MVLTSQLCFIKTIYQSFCLSAGLGLQTPLSFRGYMEKNKILNMTPLQLIATIILSLFMVRMCEHAAKGTSLVDFFKIAGGFLILCLFGSLLWAVFVYIKV